MNEKKELFEEWPVSKAVISLVVPTVLSQLITVVYNMADTFFIGQVGDPYQVAAVSLCMPLLEPVFTRGKGFGKIVAWKKKGEHRIPAA